MESVWVVKVFAYYPEDDEWVDVVESDDILNENIVGIFTSEEKAKAVKKRLDRMYLGDDIHETTITEWPLDRISNQSVFSDISEFEEVYGL